MYGFKVSKDVFASKAQVIRRRLIAGLIEFTSEATLFDFYDNINSLLRSNAFSINSLFLNSFLASIGWEEIGHVRETKNSIFLKRAPLTEIN